MSSKNGVAYPTGSSPESGYPVPFSTYTMSALQPDRTTCLRQLSNLHAAGILTDEEFHAARGRLLGS